MFKWRFIRNFRLDSHYILKILIIFNIILGIYLLFLSTNYRRYSEYPHNNDDNNKSDKLLNNNHDDELKIKKVPKQKQQQQLIQNPDKIVIISSNNNNNKINKINDQSLIDKVFDSNNQPVKIIQDNISQNNHNQNNNNNLQNNDSSYKHIEDDEKIIIDENDKLKIEMLGAKPDEQNSIIHMDLDSFINDGNNNGLNNNNNKINNSKDNNINNLNNKESIDDVLDKDVIKQIIDHNLHVKKNYSQLIIPDNINLEPLSSWTIENNDKYQIIKNYIIGINHLLINYNQTITLTTQGGPKFLYHIEQLCIRWDGPISIAVYAPGNDFHLSINIIHYLRQCSNECISKNVFWHFVYDKKYPPSDKISGPNNYLKTNKFNCNQTLNEMIKYYNIDFDFRANKSLPYPINVLRNVARKASKTKYLLASDIELYPNVGIISSFFNLIEREKKGLIPIINSTLPHVYVLPIFEVKATKKPPKTKQELSNLFKAKDAIFFHRYVCDKCQNFPDRNIWINEIPKNNTMNIFRATKRTHDRNQWEPLYIGTNDEPFYDERLTWEGKRDKMSQMYQMCLMNYDLLILDNAFLVHAPGIKKYHAKDDEKRLSYIKYNHKIYTSVLIELRKKYGNKNHC